VIDDPVPGGLTALGGPAEEGLVSHSDVKDGRVLVYVDHLPAGLTRLRYPARAEAVGRFVVPATKASCIYDPEVVGRTAPGILEVSP
jgi:uncharacterized protein YfaS (alpha-2-macroglobulin family)